MSIFISSGEASGDHYTARLAMKLRERGYSGDIWGMGGVESRNAGVRAEWNGERLQLLGLTEVFSAIPSILALRREMVERIIERAPEAVVVCDSPDYHMRLIAKLRARGYRGKIFYLSPPTVWAWRSGRANDLRRDVDECLPLFKFEHDYLLSRGCASAWRGHPLLEEYNHRAETPDLGVDYEPGKLVAFLPGSRGSEIKSLLPIMEEAASALGSMGWQPVFSVAPGLNPTVRAEMIRRFSEKGIRHYDGPGGALMEAADCAVGASGTITVEALLRRRYMVVTYRLNPISALVARCVIKTKYYAMANILAGCEMFPELLQEKATAANLTDAALAWLEDRGGLRGRTAEVMERARATLGEEGVYDFWCSRITGEAA